MDKPKAELEGLYKTEVVARLFGVTARRIQQLVQDGVLHPVVVSGTRAYDLETAVQEYTQFLIKKNSGKEKADINQLLEQKLRAEISLKEAQGELHEMKNEIARGNYLSREEVRLDYSRFFLNFKKFALSIPPRVAGNISGRLEPLEVRAVEQDIQNEITKLLNAFVVAGISAEEESKPLPTMKKRGRPKKSR